MDNVNLFGAILGGRGNFASCTYCHAQEDSCTTGGMHEVHVQAR